MTNPLKIVFTGVDNSAGKTTLVKHLNPLMRALRWEFEQVNQGDGVPDRRWRVREFAKFAGELFMATDSIVVDTGASAHKEIMRGFDEAPAARDAVDYWVLPLAPGLKEQLDVLNVAQALGEIGVPPQKVVILMNRVVHTDAIEEDFAHVFQARKLGAHVCEVPVLANQIYEILKNRESVFELASRTRDFQAEREAALATGDRDKIAAAGAAAVNHGMAQKAARNLKRVFEALPFANHPALLAEAA